MLGYEEKQIESARTLGIISVCLFIIPLAGIILGILAIVKAKPYTKKHKKADTAAGLGWIGITLSVIVWVSFSALSIYSYNTNKQQQLEQQQQLQQQQEARQQQQEARQQQQSCIDEAHTKWDSIIALTSGNTGNALFQYDLQQAINSCTGN